MALWLHLASGCRPCVRLCSAGTSTLQHELLRVSMPLPMFLRGPALPAAAPAARPPGLPVHWCRRGGPRPWAETLAGGRVNIARSGARGILLTALSSGLGGAVRACGGGAKARAVSPPCPRPPAGCGASPAAKDSGRGCWLLSSPQPPSPHSWDPLAPYEYLLFSLQP